MLEEKLQNLSAKKSLDNNDAFTLLQLIQEHTMPILSLRSIGSSPATSRPSESKIRSTNIRRRKEDPNFGAFREESDKPRSTSPKRTLFDGAPLSSCSSSAVGVSTRSAALDVHSMEDFPPMQNAAAITTRKKDKKSTKPRRITLTPLQQSVHHHTSHHQSPHFTPPLLTTLSSHPAFEVEAMTSSCSPSHLSEERRLLRRVRSKQTMKRRSAGGSSEALQSNAAIDQHESSNSMPWVTVGRSFVNKQTSEMTRDNPPQFTTDPLRTTPSKVTSLTKLNNSDTTQSSLTSGYTALTSTPLSTGSCQYIVTLNRVNNRKSLDKLSHIYSKMITDRLVPNITSEIHFIIQLLTCTQPTSQGSEHLLDTLENCVYFAVRVLYHIKSVLTSLDKATLQLLCENVRIKQLEPQLVTFLSSALEAAHREASAREHRPLIHTAFTRVPFQEETDNIKNFPNMKVFHAFKKQRDAFYSILREWEVHHNMPHWNYQSALKDKIKSLMSQPPELCSLDHLAILYQKQLLESCGYTAHVSASMGGLVEGPLKNLNPDKLMRLSERFMRQSHTSTGMCPPPAFSESEQFFSTFIMTADSYVFNQYLSSVLHHELLKLHSRCDSVTGKDVPEVLHALRVLAKFMGYLDFLPYSTVISSSLLQTRTVSPHVDVVSKCIAEAVDKQHLCLTVPWAVDYMSMMDSHALQVTQYHSLLCQMIMIYRSFQVKEEAINTDTFIVLACLGWLFEIPNMPNSFFFEILKSNCLKSCSVITNAQSKLVTRDLLYDCCPYLAGIRITLAEFAAGLQSRTSPIRKIKPIPAAPDSIQAYSSASSQLQVKLRDSFFRNHPPVLKQLCDTISERVSETAIQLVQSQVIPEHVRRGLKVLASWITKTCSEPNAHDSSFNIEELFHKNESVRTVAQVSEQTFSSVLKEATQFCQKHCKINTQKAISCLLCETISKQVVTVAISISIDWAVDLCMKWLHSKLRGIVFQEVSGGFERLRKAVRDGVKANQSQQHSASSLNTTALHNHLSLHSSGQISGQYSKPKLIPEDLVSFRHLPPCQSVSEGFNESVISSSNTSTDVTSCPLSHFMELATSAINERHKAPSADIVQRITSTTINVKEFILSEVMVIDGGYSPHLLPQHVGELLSTSMHLVALFVTHDDLVNDSSNVEECVFVRQIVSLWSVLKTLKQDIPIHILLSRDSFAHYLEKGVESVWYSLTYLLTEIIKFGIASTDTIEALWMCRIKQSSTYQRRGVVNGAAVFLGTWYNHDQQAENVEPREFRESCFVRLLSIVASETDYTNINSIKNHPSLILLSLK